MAPGFIVKCPPNSDGMFHVKQGWFIRTATFINVDAETASEDPVKLGR